MEKHSELVSDNGLVFKDMIKSDRLVLLTTSDNKLAVYTPHAKLVALLSPAHLGGKITPQSLTVSSDAETLFFLDDNKNLHSLDLTQKEKATPQLLKKEVKSTQLVAIHNELYFVHGEKIAIFAKEAGHYVESKKEIKIPQQWKAQWDQLDLRQVGKHHLLVSYNGIHFSVFDTTTGNALPGAHAQPGGAFTKFSKDGQVIFKSEQNNSFFGMQAGAVVQYMCQYQSIVRQFSPGEFGKLQAFGISENKLYLVTDNHYMIFLIPAPEDVRAEAPLMSVIRLKFPASHPTAKMFHNGEDVPRLIFVAGTKMDTVTIPLDWDKFEAIPIHDKKGHPQHYDGHSQEEYMGQSDEEGHPQPGRKTKTKKKKVVKKRKRSFDLGGMHHMRSNEYNALKDEHLKSYFYCERIRKHLVQQHLITRDGYIIENPEEFRKNQKLLREHYKSQEHKKPTKKKAAGKAPKQAGPAYEDEAAHSRNHVHKPGDAERVKKDDFREFLNDIEQVAGGQAKAGSKAHDSQRSGADLGSEKAIAEAKAKAEREASAKAHAQKEAAAKEASAKEAAAKETAAKEAAAKESAAKEAAAKEAAAKEAAAKEAAAKLQAEKDAQAKAKDQPKKDPAPPAQTTANPPAKPTDNKDAGQKPAAPAQPAAPKPEPTPTKPAAMPVKPEHDLDNEY